MLHKRNETGRLLRLAGLMLDRCMEIPDFVKNLLLHAQNVAADDLADFYPVFWAAFKHRTLQFEQAALAQSMVKLAFSSLQRYHCREFPLHY